jgi:putative ABC transport system permease protein
MTLWLDLKEGMSISWDAIRANKLRSGLTTLGIVIGIVTVTLMGTAIEGLNGAFLRSISAIGTDVLFIQKYPWFSDEPWWKMRNRRDIFVSDAKAFERQIAGVLAVDYSADTVRTIKYKNRSASGVFVSGNTENGALVGGLSLAEGRFFNEAEADGGRPVCVVGADVVANFFPHESALGKRIKIEENQFEIIGVIEKRGKFLGMRSLDNQVIIPISRFVTVYSYRPGVYIRVKVGRVEDLDEAREEMRGVMRKIRRLAPGTPDDFAINAQELFVRTFNRMGSVIASIGLFITGLSLFVGGIGIMNIMFVSVAERTREIGIRKAIGAKRRTILIQFLIEAATICLLGGLLGLLIAYPITKVINNFLPSSMSFTVMGIAIAVSLLTGVLAGFFPAWRAARMNPVDALRNE